MGRFFVFNTIFILGEGAYFGAIKGGKQLASKVKYIPEHTCFSRRIDPLTGLSYPFEPTKEFTFSQKRIPVKEVSEALQAKLNGSASKPVERYTKISVCLPSSQRKVHMAKLGATVVSGPMVSGIVYTYTPLNNVSSAAGGAAGAGILDLILDISAHRYRNACVIVGLVFGISLFSNEPIAFMLPQWKNQTKKCDHQEINTKNQGLAGYFIK